MGGYLNVYPIWTALALQSQRMIKDNYMTANYNVPKLPRPLTEAHIKKLANYADNLVLEKLRSERQRPTRDVDDYTFMRRAYLKIIGRIPGKAEIEEFKTDIYQNLKMLRPGGVLLVDGLRQSYTRILRIKEILKVLIM